MNFEKKHVNLFHILIVAPLLAFVGLRASRYEPLDRNIGMLLMLLGILVVLFHGHKVVQNGVKPLNMIHLLIVAPLLLFLGFKIYNYQPLDAQYGKALMGLAGVIVLYHGFQFYKRM